MRLPGIQTTTLASATNISGTYKYDMRGIDRASLQLNATWDTSDTSTVTLKISNDGVNFSTFSTSKTLSISGATIGLFELQNIDYAFLQVSWTTPAVPHQLTLVGVLYAVATLTQGA